jgi:hypothetical protein
MPVKSLRSSRHFFWKTTAASRAEFSPPLVLAKRTTHQPYNAHDSVFLRKVNMKSVTQVDPSENPGIRVHTNIFNTQELNQLRLQELEPMVHEYGFTTLEPYAQAVYEAQMSHLRSPPRVNMTRVTGREESVTQKRAPWKYGDEFDVTKVPPLLLTLIKRLFAVPGLNLGPVRDITINLRKNRYFRLDPHLDPQLDGENVMILSLSPTVITCSPLTLIQEIEADPQHALQQAQSLGYRSIEEYRANMSYTNYDVDTWVPAGSVCHLDADARWTWTHATRLGVEKDGQLNDWFGTPTDLRPREEDRFSVVIACGQLGEKGGLP